MLQGNKFLATALAGTNWPLSHAGFVHVSAGAHKVPMLGKTALIAALSSILQVGVLVFAQDSQPKPNPLPTSQTVGVGAPLIAWSELQRPQPIQQYVTTIEPASLKADQEQVQAPNLPGPNATARPTAPEAGATRTSQP
jgi:hypothetical protein